MPHAQRGDSRKFPAEACGLELRLHAQAHTRPRRRAYRTQKRLQKTRGQRCAGGVGKAKLPLGAYFLQAYVGKQAAGDGQGSARLDGRRGLCRRLPLRARMRATRSARPPANGHANSAAPIFAPARAHTDTFNGTSGKSARKSASDRNTAMQIAPQRPIS